MKLHSIALSIFLLLGLAGCTSSEFKVSMEMGKKALEEERYEDAVSAFSIAVQEKPDDPEVVFKEMVNQLHNQFKEIGEFISGEIKYIDSSPDHSSHGPN